MLVSPSLLAQVLFPVLGMGAFVVGAYLLASGGYRTWRQVRLDNIEAEARRRKLDAEARKAEEEAENEQLRPLWAEGAEERLAKMKELRKKPPSEPAP